MNIYERLPGEEEQGDTPTLGEQSCRGRVVVEAAVRDIYLTFC